ncbi:hypothetical protein, partial [Staphylococcus gallinarum]|uniref:hypothetical protein n=1 Tax=Staphylococcus gallinarum TaxID=1293 RepID=UPI0013C34D4D
TSETKDSEVKSESTSETKDSEAKSESTSETKGSEAKSESPDEIQLKVSSAEASSSEVTAIPSSETSNVSKVRTKRAITLLADNNNLSGTSESINFSTNISREGYPERIMTLTGNYSPSDGRIYWNLNIMNKEGGGLFKNQGGYFFLTVSTENNGKLGEAVMLNTDTTALGNNNTINYSKFNGSDGKTDPQWRTNNIVSMGSTYDFNFYTPFNGSVEDLKNLDGTDMLLTVKSSTNPSNSYRYQNSFGENKVQSSLSGTGGYDFTEYNSTSTSTSRSTSLSASTSKSTSTSTSTSTSLSTSTSRSTS